MLVSWPHPVLPENASSFQPGPGSSPCPLAPGAPPLGPPPGAGMRGGRCGGGSGPAGSTQLQKLPPAALRIIIQNSKIMVIPKVTPDKQQSPFSPPSRGREKAPRASDPGRCSPERCLCQRGNLA